MAIGESGSLSTNSPTENAPISVSFTEPLTDPVIVMSSTNVGGNGFVLRVTDIQTNADGDATGFTFIIEEWEYLDGPHPATETINWLAVESGVHTLPDGRVIEAGTTSATDGTSSVGLTGGFSDPPVVLTSVMSENDTTTVDSDPFNITASGFSVSLQEEEAQDGLHAAETVGYIAIEPGQGAVTHGTLDENVDTVGLGGSFADPVTLVDTQTINGGDPGTVVIAGGNGTDDVDLFFKEESSLDGETGHVNETVGVVTFEEGQILCFTPGARILTPVGPRPIESLAKGDLVMTEDHGHRPVRLIARTDLDQRRLTDAPDLRPVRIAAGALGGGIPARDLVVSPQHRMLLTDWRAQLLFGEEAVLAPARGLVGLPGIAVARDMPAVSYIHLGFDRHEIIHAEGAATESLHPGALDTGGIDGAAREELFEIFPELRCAPRGWGPCARPALTVRETRALAA